MANLSEIIISSTPLDNNKLHAVNGALLSKSEYNEFVSYIANYYNSSPSTPVPFIQPILSANGTLGGDDFAVYANTEFSDGNYPIWKAFNGDTTTGWATNRNPVPSNVIIYNPQALNVTLITITNRGNNENVTGGAIYASNDNSNWTKLTDFTNSNTYEYGVWAIDLSSNNGFYNYYKIECTSFTSGNAGFNNVAITASFLGLKDFTSEEVWQKEIEETGTCDKFVYDDTNNTVRLPKYGNQLYTTGNKSSNVYYYIQVKE